MGQNDYVETLCAFVDELSKVVPAMVEKWMNERNPEDQWVVITDIFGGSVNNEFMQRLQNRRFWLVSGMNLPLVIQLAMAEDGGCISESIKEALETGREMICFCNPMVEVASKEQEEF